MAGHVAELKREQRASIKARLLALHRNGVEILIWRSHAGARWHAFAHMPGGWRGACRPEQRDALAQLLTILAAEEGS